jgi:hypothetical protein
MGFFGKNKVIDLTEDYREQRKVRSKEGVVNDSLDSNKSKNQESSSGGFFGNFFGGSSSSSSSSPVTAGDIGNIHQGNIHQGNFDPETGKPIDADEKKRRLARRLKDMTDRIEEHSNQIYQMQQRIELLEKRLRTNKQKEEL